MFVPVPHRVGRLDPETARQRFTVDARSIEQIADEFGVSPGTVWPILNNQGVWFPRQRRLPGSEHDVWYYLARLRHEVVVRHRTVSAIAAEIDDVRPQRGCSCTTTFRTTR